jgi:succinoglycan biosynthesis protein ExoO
MSGTDYPTVTVVMANFNGARFVESALLNVLTQTVRNIEIIIADDASTDDSVARIRSVAATDRRVRLLQAAVRGGPGAARNMALDVARGEWIAVVDSDDLMHPDRLARLIAAAERDSADIVADNLLIFDDAGVGAPRYALTGKLWQEPSWISIRDYIEGNEIFGRSPVIGYLKPMFRGALIRDSGLRYDTSLQIGEDYDFVLRLLAAGACFRVIPDATYFYRKHDLSISHRLSRAALEPMLEADESFRAVVPQPDAVLTRALDQRRASIDRAIAFVDLVEALKRRRLDQVIRIVRFRPGVVPLLRLPLASAVSRLLFRRRRPDAMARSAKPSVCILARQRIVNAANGSSAYLLSLCEALRARGIEVHLVCPSPATFGRWPALMMGDEMRVFASVTIRGAWQIGRLFVARDPRVHFVALQTVADRVLMRLGLRRKSRVKRARYAIAAPWRAQDFLFVARHARAHADMLIADYAFLTDGFPYALRPDAPSAVVMHDLFCRRTDLEGRTAILDEATEMRLLAQADAIVAIQEDEADIVRRCLLDRRVIVAPMVATPVESSQPGETYEVLFVGSDTAANVDGLRWFLDEIWPLIRAAEKRAVFSVAGNVGRAVDAVPDGVLLLGRLPDLGPLYARVAVVVSPLRAGSGLKIKLVEALAHGKSVVATKVTIQGAEALSGDAVEVVDDPAGFAAAVNRLLADPELRQARGNAALSAARAAFSPARGHAALADFLLGAIAPKPSGSELTLPNFAGWRPGYEPKPA